MPSPTHRTTKFEGAEPILCVRNLALSLRYYVDTLGFTSADWGTKSFTAVTRGGAGIYLCEGAQGQPGTWAWIGVDDVGLLFEEYKVSGAKIREAPRNYSWAYEMQVEDPDGHVLRLGSDPRTDLPFAETTA